MQKLSRNLKLLVSPLAHKVSRAPMINTIIPSKHHFLSRPYSSKKSASLNDLDSKEQLILQLKAQAQTWNHSLNFINSMTLRCAVQLGIADVIHSHGKPMSLPQLTVALPIHPSKARHVPRLMRLLVHSGFFALEKLEAAKDVETEEGEFAYALTDASRLLVKDNPFGVSPTVGLALCPVMTKPWQHLSEWFQNEDATAFFTAHGVEFWNYGCVDAEHSRAFGEVMASDSRLVASVLMSSEELRAVFEGVESLVDVAGGTGTVAKALAVAFPGMECVVYDLPHVVDGLEGNDNVRFVGGNMFEAIPPGDAVLLKWILHDWRDEESIKILEQCKKAITSKGINKKGKVIILDMVIEKEEDFDNYESIETQLFSDMQMMVLLNGGERNEKEWAKLFSDAGFSSYKITPGLGLRSIIEVYP